MNLCSFFSLSVKWFQAFLFNTNNSIDYLSFVCTHLNRYTYLICKWIVCFVISFLNELWLICLHSSIAIVSKQLNGFNYCYLTLIILFNIDHFSAHNKVVTIIAI